MKRFLAILVAAAFLVVPLKAAASPWAIVAAMVGSDADGRDALYTVDLGGSRPKVYGPFLQGEFNTTFSSGVLDVVMLRDHRTALVSSFGDMRVFRVDVSNPRRPVITGAVDLVFDTFDIDDNPVTYTMFAEDIAVSRDNTVAIVTDGGLSSYVAFIDLATFTLNGIQYIDDLSDPLNPVGRDAQAVAIGRDNKTVLLADYLGGKIHYGKLQWSKDSIYDIKSIYLCDDIDPLDENNCLGTQAWPVNVEISPDGKTALVASAFTGTVHALRIRGAGVVEPGRSFFIGDLPGPDALNPDPGGNQSIVFSPSGASAYVSMQILPDITDPVNPVERRNRLAELRIRKPGKATKLARTYRLISKGAGQFFGVDTIAISADGSLLLASNATSFGTVNALALVRLRTRKTTAVKLPVGAVPTGVAFK